MPSNHLILCRPLLLCLQSFPASGSCPMSQFLTSGGQSIGVSASASVLPMNIQDWSSWGWTGWISLQSCYIRVLISFPKLITSHFPKALYLQYHEIGDLVSAYETWGGNKHSAIAGPGYYFCFELFFVNTASYIGPLLWLTSPWSSHHFHLSSLSSSFLDGCVGLAFTILLPFPATVLIFLRVSNIFIFMLLALFKSFLIASFLFYHVCYLWFLQSCL